MARLDFGFDNSPGEGVARPVVVLGHFPDYRSVAADAALPHFMVAEDHWKVMSATARWAMNRLFLDKVIQHQLAVWLVTPPQAARPGSSYARELKHLLSAGYVYDPTQHMMIFPINNKAGAALSGMVQKLASHASSSALPRTVSQNCR